MSSSPPLVRSPSSSICPPRTHFYLHLHPKAHHRPFSGITKKDKSYNSRHSLHRVHHHLRICSVCGSLFYYSCWRYGTGTHYSSVCSAAAEPATMPTTTKTTTAAAAAWVTFHLYFSKVEQLIVNKLLCFRGGSNGNVAVQVQIHSYETHPTGITISTGEESSFKTILQELNFNLC